MVVIYNMLCLTTANYKEQDMKRQFFGQNLKKQNEEKLYKLPKAIPASGEQLELDLGLTNYTVYKLEPYPYYIFKYDAGIIWVLKTREATDAPLHALPFTNMEDTKIFIRAHFNKGEGNE